MQVYIERRAPARSLSLDVVRHLLARALPPSLILIVCENPERFLPVLRKKWSSLLRQVSTEQSRTLRASRLRDLSVLRMRLEAMRFRVSNATEVSRADIQITKPSDLASCLPKAFHTAYVLEPLSAEDQDRVLGLVDYHGLVVLYGPGSAPDADAET